jgi:hypothetical protein
VFAGLNVYSLQKKILKRFSDIFGAFRMEEEKNTEHECLPHKFPISVEKIKSCHTVECQG